MRSDIRCLCAYASSPFLLDSEVPRFHIVARIVIQKGHHRICIWHWHRAGAYVDCWNGRQPRDQVTARRGAGGRRQGGNRVKNGSCTQGGRSFGLVYRCDLLCRSDNGPPTLPYGSSLVKARRPVLTPALVQGCRFRRALGFRWPSAKRGSLTIVG
jgi:hypothetical protein